MVDGSEAFLQVEIRIFHTWLVGNVGYYHPHVHGWMEWMEFPWIPYHVAESLGIFPLSPDFQCEALDSYHVEELLNPKTTKI